MSYLQSPVRSDTFREINRNLARTLAVIYKNKWNLNLIQQWSPILLKFYK